MTELFDTKTKPDFKIKNYGRHQSLNALRVQASCGNELCQHRAVLPPPGSPRCNCTEILVNDLHHERCTTGHFCEVCFWYVLESLRNAKYMEVFVNDSNSKWKVSLSYFFYQSKDRRIIHQIELNSSLQSGNRPTHVIAENHATIIIQWFAVFADSSAIISR